MPPPGFLCKDNEFPSIIHTSLKLLSRIAVYFRPFDPFFIPRFSNFNSFYILLTFIYFPLAIPFR